MCDYSLHNIASRFARIGDILVTRSFPNSSARGFADIGQPNIAVCLLPGTELAFEKNVKWERTFLSLWRRVPFGKLVRSRQINVDISRTVHDAVEFPNGKVILVAALCEGQRARVLQLPAASQVTQRARYADPTTDADPDVIDLIPMRGRDPSEFIYSDPWTSLYGYRSDI